ncbi:MAG: phosphatidate cytidylyltransferase [Leptospirillia bacterium]
MLGKDRLITAAVALPAVAACVLFLPPAAFALLIGLVAAAGQWELYRFRFTDRLPAAAWAGCAVGVLVVALEPPMIALAPGAILILTLRLFSGKRESALADTGVIVLGLVYVAVLIAHIAYLKGMGAYGCWVIYLMLITWCGDAAAYYVGRTLGKTPLTEISPNKTVEGTLGGFAASIAAAYAGMLLVPAMAWWEPLVIGLLLGPAALIGDLVESQFKRGAGVKDSSTLIPAHGGVLDKLDAFLFTAPVLFYYLKFRHMTGDVESIAGSLLP